MLEKVKQYKLYIIELALILASLILFLVPKAHYTFYGDSFECERGAHMESLMDVAVPGVYVDNSMMEEGEDVIEVFTPVANLHLGTYMVHLQYINSDHNNTFTAMADYNTYPVVTKRMNWGLEEGESYGTETVFRLNSWQKMDGYRVSFNYTGNGYFYVYGLEIVETIWWKVMIFLTVLGGCILLNLYLYFKKTMDKKVLFGYIYAFILGIMASMPVMTLFFFGGDDSSFHMGRMEALAHAIQEGDLPLRVSNLWMNGKGYASALFYCDIFMFPAALLRTLGNSFQGTWQFYMTMVNVATALIAFYSFRRIAKTNLGAIMSTTLYVFSSYRMHCMYKRFAVGDYTAHVFLPLMLYGLYRIYYENTDEKKSLKENFRASLPFMIGVSGVVMSHTQSTIMCAIFIFFFVLINFKKTFKFNVITRLFSALFGIIIFNMWYVLPFLEMSGSLQFTEGADTLGRYAANGTFLYQLFSLFPQGFGGSYPVFDAWGRDFATEMPFTAGPAAIGVFVYIILRLSGLIRKNRLADKLTVGAIMAMFMTTIYFPWDFIEQLSPLTASITHTLMCPWRFMGIAYTLSSALSGVLYELLLEDKDRLSRFAMPMAIVIMVFGFVGGSFYLTTRTSNVGWDYRIDETGDFSNFSEMGGEYLPAGYDNESYLATEAVAGEGVELVDAHRDGKAFYATVTNTGSDVSYVDVPFNYYKGYRAVDDTTGQKFKTSVGAHALTRVELPAGYEGTVKVWYKEPGHWRVYEIISVITILGYIGYRLFDRKKRANA